MNKREHAAERTMERSRSWISAGPTPRCHDPVAIRTLLDVPGPSRSRMTMGPCCSVRSVHEPEQCEGTRCRQTQRCVGFWVRDCTSSHGGVACDGRTISTETTCGHIVKIRLRTGRPLPAACAARNSNAPCREPGKKTEGAGRIADMRRPLFVLEEHAALDGRVRTVPNPSGSTRWRSGPPSARCDW